MVPEVRAGLCQSTPAPTSRPGDTWRFDEVFLTINGPRHYLWRAVDQDGHVLDILAAKPPPQAGGEEVFPQAAERVDVRAAGTLSRTNSKAMALPNVTCYPAGNTANIGT